MSNATSEYEAASERAKIESWIAANRHAPPRNERLPRRATLELTLPNLTTIGSLLRRDSSGAVHAVQCGQGRWQASFERRGAAATQLALADSASGAVVWATTLGDDVVTAAAFAPLAARLAIGTLQGAIRVFDLESRSLAWSAATYERRVITLAWSAGGQRLAAIGDDRVATAFVGEDGQLLRAYRHVHSPLTGIAFCEHDQFILLSSGDVGFQLLRIDPATHDAIDEAPRAASREPSRLSPRCTSAAVPSRRS